jgi:chemotaxis protein MotC
MANQIQRMPETASKDTTDTKPPFARMAAAGSSDTAAQGLDQLRALSKARDALSRVDNLIKNQASVTP